MGAKKTKIVRITEKELVGIMETIVKEKVKEKETEMLSEKSKEPKESDKLMEARLAKLESILNSAKIVKKPAKK